LLVTAACALKGSARNVPRLTMRGHGFGSTCLLEALRGEVVLVGFLAGVAPPVKAIAHALFQ
jgi:hypothetical protein